jgi:hypothetical protein
MTSASLGMGATLFPLGSSPSLLPLEKVPNVMNFFYHSAILELVFDRVWVMQIGRFKKFLKVVFGRSSLPLEVMFDGRYELLTGVVGSLIAVVVIGHYGNAMGSALLPLFATLSTFPGAFDGGLGGHGSTTVGDLSRVT